MRGLNLSDQMGYPDGWNQLAYCGNGVTSSVDFWGCRQVDLHKEILFGDEKPLRYEKYGEPYWDYNYFGEKHKYQGAATTRPTPSGRPTSPLATPRRTATGR